MESFCRFFVAFLYRRFCIFMNFYGRQTISGRQYTVRTYVFSIQKKRERNKKFVAACISEASNKPLLETAFQQCTMYFALHSLSFFIFHFSLFIVHCFIRRLFLRSSFLRFFNFGDGHSLNNTPRTVRKYTLHTVHKRQNHLFFVPTVQQ